jgi:membrane-associated protein
LWGAGITLLGYTLGRAFPAIGENIEIAVVVIVFVSILPVIIEFIRHRRSAKGDHFAE